MTVDMTPFEHPPAVAGTRLDGTAPYRIAASENAAICGTCGVAPAADGTAHPIFYFIASQVGMGLTVKELCAACDFDVDDGPMMIDSHVGFDGALHVERDYRVSGEIVGLERRESRKLGIVDTLTYRLSLHAEDHAKGPVVSLTNRWVLPRGGQAR